MNKDAAKTKSKNKKSTNKLLAAKAKMKLKKIKNGESGVSKEELTVKGDTRMKSTIVPFDDLTED